MRTADYRDHLTIGIEGTFDVAIARNRLRQLADHFDLPTVLRARAAAAITTACEMVLFKSQHNKHKMELTIHIIQEGDKQGVELQFYAPFTTEIVIQNSAADGQLHRACDDLHIDHQGDDDLITMFLWVREKYQ